MSKSRRTSDLVNSLLVNADNSVNIHEGTQSPYFQLDTAATPTLQPGMFGWNDAYGTADLRLKGGNVTLQLGQETLARVVNKTGADLLESQYKVVRVRIASEGGAQGQRLAVVLAQGNNDPDSVTTLGLVTENIANNQEGFITIFGNVNGINTTGSLQGETWVDGDVLYLSPTTPGGLTKVKPTAPDHTVTVGYVVYAHANQGKIFVKVDNGYELDELHNVKITSVANNDLLQYDSTQQVWKNVAASVAVPTPTLAQVTTAGNTTTNAISVGGLTVATNLIYTDTVNSRVGIGTSTPVELLEIGNTSKSNTKLKVVSDSFSTATGIEISRGSSVWNIVNNGNLQIVRAGTSFLHINISGNVGVGTTTDAGYKLDVNGTAKFTAGGKDLKILDGGGLETDLTTGYSNLRLKGNGNTGVYVNLAGRVSIPLNLAVGDTYINSNTPPSRFLVTGSQTATSALAQGVYFNNTLVAAANNDVLVGLDINPTFTNGAFTGVSNYALRVTGISLFAKIYASDTIRFVAQGNTSRTGFLFSTYSNNSIISGALVGYDTEFTFNPNDGNATYTGFAFSTGINQTGTATGITRGIYINPSLTSAYDFRAIETKVGKVIFGSTSGNVLIGTTTDAGYKLDVNGTFRVSGVSTLGQIVINGGTQAKSYVDISSNLPAFRLWSADYSTFYGGLGSSAWAGSTGNDPAILAGAGLGIKFLVNGGSTPNMTVASNGNVLIGTTTDAGYKLLVNGTVKAGITRLGYVSTYTNSNAALYVGNAVSGSNNAKLIIDPYEADNTYYKLVLESRYDGSQPFSLYSTGNQTWLYGYGNPMLYQLPAMKIPNQISMGTLDVAKSEISGSVLFIHGSDYYARASYIRMTSYTTGVDVLKGVVMGLWTGDNLRFWNYENTAINIGTNNVERITVLGNGNVGISNTSPAYKLDVIGDINTNSGYRMNGVAGWTGTINIPTNPPGQQNIDVQGGIIVNVF